MKPSSPFPHSNLLSPKLFARFFAGLRSAPAVSDKPAQTESNPAVRAVRRAAAAMSRKPRSQHSSAFGHTVQALSQPSAHEAAAAARQRDIKDERARCKTIYEIAKTAGCPRAGVELMKSDMSVDVARSIAAAIAEDLAASTNPSPHIHGDTHINRLKALGVIH
ncbi:hypothetical protein [Burkholderia gladioli]|uniref:hypothetical protein n=1 Tax=Burkholderia gladioli TaxID=28095 RepID=UPI00163E3096|nr:hypothetical protein [Burkholderia gladioli]